MRIARERPEPIPVYAEMSSINPVILLPAALAARAADIGSGFVASLTMGAGQFCTNPGLVLAVTVRAWISLSPQRSRRSGQRPPRPC